MADGRSGAAYSPYRDEPHRNDPYADDAYDAPYDGAAHELTVAAPTTSRRPRPAPYGRNQLRADFGAHFETNYPRLVAQLYAITLNSAEAHDVVQEAYSRAWKQWASVGRLRDPAEWVRRVAVRSTIRSWRRALSALGIGRPRPFGDIADRRTAALLAALARLSVAERRAVVLHHMVGWSAAEIAVVERSSPGAVGVRLNRASQIVVEGMADVLSEVLGSYGEDYR